MFSTLNALQPRISNIRSEKYKKECFIYHMNTLWSWSKSGVKKSQKQGVQVMLASIHSPNKKPAFPSLFRGG